MKPMNQAQSKFLNLRVNFWIWLNVNRVRFGFFQKEIMVLPKLSKVVTTHSTRVKYGQNTNHIINEVKSIKVMRKFASNFF